MNRTQVYLDEEETNLLSQASARTGASRSELIRRAVRAQYQGQSPEGRLAALRASTGIWSNRTGNGSAYVEEIRTGLNERLAQAGLQ